MHRVLTIAGVCMLCAMGAGLSSTRALAGSYDGYDRGDYGRDCERYCYDRDYDGGYRDYDRDDGYYGGYRDYDRYYPARYGGYDGYGYRHHRHYVCDPDGDRCYRSRSYYWNYREYYRRHGYRWED
jgi:hypothetical protein